MHDKQKLNSVVKLKATLNVWCRYQKLLKLTWFWKVFLYILQPAWSKPGWTLRRRLRLWIREETPESATSLSHWGEDWGRGRVMQCAFSICSRGQFEVVYSLEVVCILYNSCVYCTNLLAKLSEIFWWNWMHMEILVKTILHSKDGNISEYKSIGYCCIFDGWLECLNLNSCQHLQFSRDQTIRGGPYIT